MNKHSSNDKYRNSFRIIAGTWRSRRLSFPDGIESLRPTTDRIRETLFNWLQQKIPGARCLDLFTGSGALAFEALSRGAASVTAVDASPLVANAVRDNARLLHTGDIDMVTGNALQWLQQQAGARSFDVVFLDPPYSENLLPECMRLLDAGNLVAAGGVIYMEAARPLEDLAPPARWKLLRSKKAGQVYYGLYESIIDHGPSL